MDTYIGIKDVRWVPLQKQELLLFHKIGVPFVQEALSGMHGTAECADLEWLLGQGLVIPIDAEQAWARVHDRKERDRFVLSALLSQTFLILNHFKHKHQLDPIELERLSHFRFHLVEGALRLISLGLEPMLQARVTPILGFDREAIDIEAELEQVLQFLRTLPVGLKNLEVSPGAISRDDGIQVIRRTEALLEEGAATLLVQQQSPVLKLVLQKMPIIDDSTPLEAIIDFRNDPATRHSFLELRRWVRKISEGAADPIDIAAEMEYLASAYQEHMRVHRMKHRVGVIESAIMIGPEILRNLLGFRWPAAAKALFSLQGKRVALLEAEASAPGREVAYLVKAKEYFGR